MADFFFKQKFQDLEEERLDFTKSSLWAYANIASTVCVSDDAVCSIIWSRAGSIANKSNSPARRFVSHWRVARSKKTSVVLFKTAVPDKRFQMLPDLSTLLVETSMTPAQKPPTRTIILWHSFKEPSILPSAAPRLSLQPTNLTTTPAQSWLLKWAYQTSPLQRAEKLR